MEKSQLELILINISGQDHPGVTSALSEILAKYHAGILDIGQADIHHTLSLGILIRTEAAVSGNIMKELLFKATELNVNIRFSPVSIREYEQWVGMQGKDRWIITILGRRLTARQIANVTAEISAQGMNIDSIQRLTGRMPLGEEEQPLSKSCVEFSVRGVPRDVTAMQERFMHLTSRRRSLTSRCRRTRCSAAAAA